jgi:GT2 family glycosyltransferase
LRILVQIHTWNGAHVIGSLLEKVLQQSFPVSEILIVDNASTDGTAELDYPDIVTLVRHQRNLGTSGSVKTGIEYAIGKGYEWLWVLDADSMPRRDALELLVRMIEGAEVGDGEIGVACSAHDLVSLGKTLYGRLLTPGGPRVPQVREDLDYVECDSVIWSGALFNLAVVPKIGLPRAGTRGCWEDLSLDYGDIEYSYRINRAGYKIFVHRHSLIDHPIGKGRHGRFLGLHFYSSNHPAFRRYLYFRNLVYFWLRIYHRRHWPSLLVWFLYRLCATMTGILVVEDRPGCKLEACFAGIRDGLFGRLDRSFEPEPNEIRLTVIP